MKAGRVRVGSVRRWATRLSTRTKTTRPASPPPPRCCSGARFPRVSLPLWIRSRFSEFLRGLGLKTGAGVWRRWRDGGRTARRGHDCRGNKMWFVYENAQRRKSEEGKTDPRRPMGGGGWRLRIWVNQSDPTSHEPFMAMGVIVVMLLVGYRILLVDLG